MFRGFPLVTWKPVQVMTPSAIVWPSPEQQLNQQNPEFRLDWLPGPSWVVWLGCCFLLSPLILVELLCPLATCDYLYLN